MNVGSVQDKFASKRVQIALAPTACSQIFLLLRSDCECILGGSMDAITFMQTVELPTFVRLRQHSRFDSATAKASLPRASTGCLLSPVTACTLAASRIRSKPVPRSRPRPAASPPHPGEGSRLSPWEGLTLSSHTHKLDLAAPLDAPVPRNKGPKPDIYMKKESPQNKRRKIKFVGGKIDKKVAMVFFFFVVFFHLWGDYFTSHVVYVLPAGSARQNRS